MQNASEEYGCNFCKLCANNTCHLPSYYYIAGIYTLKIILKLIQVYNSAQSVEKIVINTVV